MLGGGFSDQMNKTLKLNRDNLKRSMPKPFDKDRLSERWTTESANLRDAPPMNAAERDRLLQRLEENKRRQYLTRVLLFLILGAATLGALWLANT